MQTLASKRRSGFGTNCFQCDNELIAPEGPSIGMSGKYVIFGTVLNATAISWSFRPRTPSR